MLVGEMLMRNKCVFNRTFGVKCGKSLLKPDTIVYELKCCK